MQEDVESRTSQPNRLVRNWRTANGKLASASFSGYAASMDTDFSKVLVFEEEIIFKILTSFDCPVATYLSGCRFIL